jgi:RNA polymerase sigma factor (sigma-70 family)
VAITESMPDHFNVNDMQDRGAAFAMLYEQFMPKVFRYIDYRVGDIRTAEELTSYVFEKALAGFHSFNPGKASFFTWLMSITRHTLIDYFRVNKKEYQAVPLEKASEVSTNDPSPEEEAQRKEEQQRLRVCMAGLSLQEQEIISLKFGAEMNNRQIAGLLYISESNVGTILYRAVRKLRDSFKEWQNEQ